MRSSTEQSGTTTVEKKYKGARRRKWGKWVSEIRVPGSQERLWLGSYATPEAAAVAHDVAFFCLRRPPSLDGLNFPQLLPASFACAVLSPKSVQKAASDAGMGIDAQIISNRSMKDEMGTQFWEEDSGDCGKMEEELSISVEDYDYME